MFILLLLLLLWLFFYLNSPICLFASFSAQYLSLFTFIADKSVHCSTATVKIAVRQIHFVLAFSLAVSAYIYFFGGRIYVSISIFRTRKTGLWLRWNEFCAHYNKSWDQHSSSNTNIVTHYKHEIVPCYCKYIASILHTAYRILSSIECIFILERPVSYEMHILCYKVFSRHCVRCFLFIFRCCCCCFFHQRRQDKRIKYTEQCNVVARGATILRERVWKKTGNGKKTHTLAHMSGSNTTQHNGLHCIALTTKA